MKYSFIFSLAIILALCTSLIFAEITPAEEMVVTVDREHLIDFPAPDTPVRAALVMVENNCKLRNQFKGARRFLAEDLPFYPDVSVKLVPGKPRVKFFESVEDAQNAVIDPAFLTTEQLLQVLDNVKNDPHHYDPKHTVTDVYISRDTTVDDLTALFERFGIQRGLTYLKDKEVFLLETGDSDPNLPEKFDYDEILRDVNPDHTIASPPEGYDYNAEMRAREEGEAQRRRIIGYDGKEYTPAEWEVYLKSDEYKAYVARVDAEAAAAEEQQPEVVVTKDEL